MQKLSDKELLTLIKSFEKRLAEIQQEWVHGQFMEDRSFIVESHLAEALVEAQNRGILG